MTKLWGGRFQKSAEAWVDEFGASIGFDQQLVMEDIEGSIAHVTMLGAQGILPAEDVAKIIDGLKQLNEKAIAGELEFTVANEDIHLNLEKMLDFFSKSLAGAMFSTGFASSNSPVDNSSSSNSSVSI